MDQRIPDLLDYWFSPEMNRHWFASTPELDQDIRERYESLWQEGQAGHLDAWQETPEGALALLIVLDQLPLNMFRNEPRSFASEAKAVVVARAAIGRGHDRALARERLLFIYLPLMHSENLADQEQSVELFSLAGLDTRWAEHHRDIVRRFGRFPHRNAILGRASSQDELDWLASPQAFKG